MKLRIFVIDDEECIRDTFKWHLEAQGHEVITAPEPLLCDVYCGGYCRVDDPCGHILLTDYMMPRMTGLEFIEQMTLKGCKSLPVNKYIMSGHVDAIDMKRVQRVGCNVVEKPLTLDELDKIIETSADNINPDRKLADLAAKLNSLEN